MNARHPRYLLIFFWALLIMGAAYAAYSNSFHGPFVFDDLISIVNNPQVSTAWHSVSDALNPPPSSIAGRPVATATFMLNYRLGWLETSGYHAANFVIHIATALALMGLVRRTLLLPGVGWSDAHAASAAGIAALIWAVHPLNTSAVTYVAQRTESLMAMFYVLTLYTFVCGCTGHRLWHAVTFTACLLGMASKEVMVSAPIAVILYDRTFIAENWRAVRDRLPVHLALTATWFPLAFLVLSEGAHKTSTGFQFEEVAVWGYLCAQAPAILHYLWLTVWPVGLVFDYGEANAGTDIPHHWEQYVPHGVAILALLLVTGWLLWKHPRWGWPCALFFLVLAPSSSVMPIVTEVVAEHRFYLPLAVVIALPVVAVACLVARSHSRIAWAFAAIVVTAVASPLAYQTHLRNRDYQSSVTLWSDTVEKRPTNVRSLQNLGLALMRDDRGAEAIPFLRTATNLMPGMIDAHRALGQALRNTGQLDAALDAFDAALKINPSHAETLNDKGTVLTLLNRLPEAEAQFAQAVTAAPQYALALCNLGVIRVRRGDARGAIDPLRRAIRVDGDSLDAMKLLAWVLSTDPNPTIRDGAEAVRLAQRACDLSPSPDAEALDALAAANAEAGRFEEAVKMIDRAIQAAEKSGNTGILSEALLHRAAFLKGRPWRQ
ncbi:MAG: tetratricopeptide repeat protein [Planctomycetes bacterium]|nr:tetratricopeptide repeat protein [Planctomycetota bacterium]